MASALKFKEDGGLFADDLEIAILAMDETGKIRDGAKDTAELKLRPETHAAVAKNGVRMTRRLSLAARPVSAADRRPRERRRPGRLGDVRPRRPRFLQGRPRAWAVCCSRRLVGAGSRPRTPTLTSRTSCPARRRRCASSRGRRAVARGRRLRQPCLHAAPRRDSHDGDRRQRDGRVQLARRAQSEELKGATGTFGHIAKVPLKDVAPGRYVLRVEAQSLLSNGGDGGARSRVHGALVVHAS